LGEKSLTGEKKGEFPYFKGTLYPKRGGELKEDVCEKECVKHALVERHTVLKGKTLLVNQRALCVVMGSG